MINQYMGVALNILSRWYNWKGYTPLKYHSNWKSTILKVFAKKGGEFPASYVSLPEGTYAYSNDRPTLNPHQMGQSLEYTFKFQGTQSGA